MRFTVFLSAIFDLVLHVFINSFVEKYDHDATEYLLVQKVDKRKILGIFLNTNSWLLAKANRA